MKDLLRDSRFWLTTLGPGLAVGLFLSQVNLPRYRRLVHDGVQTEGTVTAIDCRKDRVSYTFWVGGQHAIGRFRTGGPVRPSCREYAVGTRVPVVYSASDPAVNAQTRDPEALLRRERIIVPLAGLAASVGCAVVYVMNRRKATRPGAS